MHVFIHTNRFREQDKQYSGSTTISFTEATSDSRRLIATGLYGLKRIYRPSYWYKKAGIMLMELTPVAVRQQSLFSEENPKAAKVMQANDALNGEYGRNVISHASERYSPKVV